MGNKMKRMRHLSPAKINFCYSILAKLPQEKFTLKMNLGKIAGAFRDDVI
jgi:hypothetical protein